MKEVMTPEGLGLPLSDFANRVVVLIKKEQSKISPDVALLDVLYNSLRLGYDVQMASKKRLADLKEELERQEQE